MANRMRWVARRSSASAAAETHGDTQMSDWILPDVHLDGERRPEGIEIHWHYDGVLAIFPITRERFRVIADIGIQGVRLPPGNPTLEEVQDALDRRGPGGLKLSQPVWLAGFRINRRDGVVCVRDAFSSTWLAFLSDAVEEAMALAWTSRRKKSTARAEVRAGSSGDIRASLRLSSFRRFAFGIASARLQDGSWVPRE